MNALNDLNLLIDLHKNGPRQGPGGDAETRLAVTISGLKEKKNLKVADLGCGTGAATLVLAQALDAHITAVDMLPEFLAHLEAAIDRAGVSERITTLRASIEALPFHAAEYDAIWSEGAIYNMGFSAGIAAWRKYLKPGGILAVSELTWLTDQRPLVLQAHWEAEYSEVDTASAKLAGLERSGFAPMGYFTLPEHCWLNNYYRPLEKRFAGFLERHEYSQAAQKIVAAEKQEISLYKSYKTHVGYGYYIARKVGG